MTNKDKPCCGSPKGDDKIKSYVKEHYGQAALKAQEKKKASCCSSCDTDKDAISRDIYSEAETSGIPIEALLASLGCANPIALAKLNPGETVLDLGSGGGIDVLLSAKRVGPTGKAYGLDMTDEMLALANKNKKEAKIENVEFLKGEIESIPLPDDSIDVIISNCVINLSTDKDKVLKEAFRVLKPGGRFAVADIVLTKPISNEFQKHLALWAGCVAGALRDKEYIEKLTKVGFKEPSVKIAKVYTIEDTEGIVPDSVIKELGREQTSELMSSFISAFITATKPALQGYFGE